jgi:hypothetical protein
MLTLAHWVILAIQLDVLVNIPGWYWEFRDKPVTPRYLVFLLLLAALFLGLRWIAGRPKAVRRNLALLLVLGYATQLSIGISDGKGIESLRQKYLTSFHRSYIDKASSRGESVVESIRRYEEIYSDLWFTRTKPPGVISFYVALERAVNALGHQTSPDARMRQLSTLVAYLFPVLSMLGVWMTYQFGAHYAGGGETAPGSGPLTNYLGAMFFMVAPNIVLLTLFLDQALYPSLFLISVMLIISAIRRRSLLLAFLMGCALFGVIFFTFSMLPLFALAAIFAAAQIWLHPSKHTLVRMVGLGLAAGLGVAAMALLFRIALNYDILVRYTKAMSVVYDFDFYLRVGMDPGQPITFTQRVGQIFTAGLLNNIEMASMVSVPIFLLFLLRGIKASAAVLGRRSVPGEVVQASVFITYVLLNAYGQVRGETGRLWMFWVPVIAIFAAIEAAPLVKRMPVLMYVLLAAQFITLILIYQFQGLFV